MKTATSFTRWACGMWIAALVSGTGQAAFPRLRLEVVCDRQLVSPVAMAVPGDGSGRLFIVEQRGAVRIFRDGVLQPGAFLDLEAKLVPEMAGFDERGLLGMAFHPDYAAPGSAGEGRFYVFYNAPSPAAPGTSSAPVDCRSTLSEFRVQAGDPDVASVDSERVLLTFDKPQFNHNGGQLDFGPDGFLYLGTGDGGASNDNTAGHTGGSSSRPGNALGNAQDRTLLMGKILRIDPLGSNGPGGQYGIPPENPFVGEGGGIREEIYAWGLRNPWRFSFDTGTGGTGRLFCADVGQGQVEEVDLITAGGNYGWRNREGSFVPAFSRDAPDPPAGVTLIDPVAQYAHPGVTIGTPALPAFGISVTGGYVYRGSAIPELAGKYLFGDWSSSFSDPRGWLLGLEEGPPGTFTLSAPEVEGGNPIGRFVLSFGRDETGELYVLTKQSPGVSVFTPDGRPTGSILKVVPASTTVSLTAARDNTMYSESGNSNGRGRHLFAGTIRDGDFRRALLAFDVSGIPASSRIQSAALTLRMNRSVTGAFNFNLHRVLRQWGEGASAAPDPEGIGTPALAGDATWTRAVFPDTSWDLPGGDFEPGASASASVGAIGSFTWTSAGMAEEVRQWVGGGLPNHGWILKAASETVQSAKRFSSRENPVPSEVPRLEVSYVPGEILTHRQQWERRWFLRGEFVEDSGDPDGDSISNGVEYAWGFNPQQGDPPVAGFTADFSAAGGTPGVVEFTFRRDVLAVDLTYHFEAGANLGEWTDLTTSVGGAEPAGEGFISESPAPGEPEIRLVRVRDSVMGGARRYYRLRVIRP